MSSLDLSRELRDTDSAGRLTGLEQRLKDPGWIEARVAEDVRVKGRTAASHRFRRSTSAKPRDRSAATSARIPGRYPSCG